MAEPAPSPSTELRKTVIDPAAGPEGKQKDLSGLPVRQLVAFKREKNLWQGVAFGSLLAALGAVLFFHNQENAKPYVYVVDGAGSMHWGPLEALNPNSTVYTNTALWATQALLQRSPIGFDLGELVSAYFRANAADKARDDLEQQRAMLEAEAMHTKPEIDAIHFEREAGRVVIMRVSGQLIRSGNLTEQQLRRPALPFRLKLAIVPNPRLSQVDGVPFVVSDFALALDYRVNDEIPPSASVDPSPPLAGASAVPSSPDPGH